MDHNYFIRLRIEQYQQNIAPFGGVVDNLVQYGVSESVARTVLDLLTFDDITERAATQVCIAARGG